MRRELRRAGLYLKGFPELFTDRLKQKKLDRAIETGLPMTEGAIEPSGKIAILLIYQPNGIQRSTIEQCSWLAGNGYAPLLVCNSRLSTHDLDRLRPFFWRAISRANFGHDFGGYRDALFSLESWGIAPETLLVLNDSVWVPIIPGSDLLNRLEGDPSDICGTVWRERGDRRFLEGYCYRFRQNVLRSPEFKQFWSSMLLTSNKYYVIRRGERGLSYHMQGTGFSMASVYDPKRLHELIAQESDEFLFHTIKYAANLPSSLKSAYETLLLDWPDTNQQVWRERALTFIGEVSDLSTIYSTFPVAACQLLGFPFLKKTGNDNVVEWRKAYLAAVDAGLVDKPSPAILEEIRASFGPSPNTKGTTH